MRPYGLIPNKIINPKNTKKLQGKKMKCRICHNTDNNSSHKVKEMMYGMMDIFDYFQCGNCNCLQIENFPDDIEKYYPENYYSYTATNPPYFWKRYALKLRDQYAVFKKNLLGKVIYNKFPNERLKSLSNIKVNIETRILDVGCGGGDLLRSLQELGFKNLMGIDPFNKNNLVFNNDLKILKKSIAEVEDCWDIIMFHHSFEHISEQQKTLDKVSSILSSNGSCIIRVPTVSSFAWEHYGVNWVQLDAPRHYFLHSIESMKILCKKSGMKIREYYYDSTLLQLAGSEQYLKNVPLRSGKSYSIDLKNSMFSKKDLKKFKKKSVELNKEKKGDQIVFVLQKI